MIIDSDYAGNDTNDGEIFMQLINFAPFPIFIPSGIRIAQGIILNYNTVENDDACGKRIGGLGSTG